MKASTVHVRREGRVVWITLDRPPLNVFDIPMMRALSAALVQGLKETDFLVFDAAGKKGFSAGAEVRDHTPDRIVEMLGAFHSVFRQLWRADCVTSAAVQGHCLGGGCELATFCDFVIATELATFGQPEIKLGCFPPVAIATFPHLIGPRAALDLILTGRTILSREALDLGLITRVVPEGELASAVKLFLSELRKLSPAVLRLTHRTLWRASGFDFDEVLNQVEEMYLNQLMKTEDASEGIRAFLEKRAPVWQGR
jgi:cyclohexa-1,5-dienecarbonyl-CoA hydratase